MIEYETNDWANGNCSKYFDNKDNKPIETGNRKLYNLFFTSFKFFTIL